MKQVEITTKNKFSKQELKTKRRKISGKIKNTWHHYENDVVRKEFERFLKFKPNSGDYYLKEIEETQILEGDDLTNNYFKYSISGYICLKPPKERIVERLFKRVQTRGSFSAGKYFITKYKNYLKIEDYGKMKINIIGYDHINNDVEYEIDIPYKLIKNNRL
jgi:hypothetical protein